MDYDRLVAFREKERLGFTDLAIDFSKRLAEAIFREGQGVNSVAYWTVADGESWKQQFFGGESKTQMLMEASPLICRTSAPSSRVQTRGRRRSNEGGDTFRFSHLSILDYFYALSIYDPMEDLPRLDSPGFPSHAGDSYDLSDHPLSRQNLVDKPAVLQFLADRVKYIDDFKHYLHALVQLSMNYEADTSVSCAAFNAITILIRAGERFNDADLKDIRIPGADLSYGDFDSAQLQGADSRNTTLRNVWLHQADLSSSQMVGVKFGEYPHLEVDSGVLVVYCTSSWNRILFPGSDDENVPLRDAQAGALASSLTGHTEDVKSVAFSPSGHQIASGSGDMTVRLWDAQSSALISTLSGHTQAVNSVVFSPSGRQIASGSHDTTVRLWDAQTGSLASSLSGHTDTVTCVAFSPSGHQIASGSMDMTVRFWDAHTSALVTSLSGHKRWVTTLAYSPSGDKIASGSDDDSARLWDTDSGQCIVVLGGFQDIAFGIAWKDARDGLFRCRRQC